MRVVLVPIKKNKIKPHEYYLHASIESGLLVVKLLYIRAVRTKAHEVDFSIQGRADECSLENFGLSQNSTTETVWMPNFSRLFSYTSQSKKLLVKMTVDEYLHLLDSI